MMQVALRSMPDEKWEKYIQQLYRSFSQLLSGEIRQGRESILRIVRECQSAGACEEELSEEIIHLSDITESYVKGEIYELPLANCIHRTLISGKPLAELSILIIREVCSERFVTAISSWSEDPEPIVRIAYLKCLSKLYDEGAIKLDELSKFALDPSPAVRDAFVSLLTSYIDRKEVVSILIGMLNREKRSSIRSKILTALSESLEESRNRKGGSRWKGRGR